VPREGKENDKKLKKGTQKNLLDFAIVIDCDLDRFHWAGRRFFLLPFLIIVGRRLLTLCRRRRRLGRQFVKFSAPVI
jgi:hypothetical protein